MLTRSADTERHERSFGNFVSGNQTNLDNLLSTSAWGKCPTFCSSIFPLNFVLTLSAACCRGGKCTEHAKKTTQKQLLVMS